jgi:Na+/proline symporter
MSFVHLHLLLNHVPVIGIVFVVFVLLAALRLRNDGMAKLALIMLAGIAAVTALVYFTGEPAEDAVEKLAGVSKAIIHDHEEAAELSFIATSIGGVLALVVLWFNRRRELARATIVASLGGVLVISGMMAWTANLGGAIRHTEIGASAGGEVGHTDDSDDK